LQVLGVGGLLPPQRPQTAASDDALEDRILCLDGGLAGRRPLAGAAAQIQRQANDADLRLRRPESSHVLTERFQALPLDRRQVGSL
jgi:hypothetical protein